MFVLSGELVIGLGGCLELLLAFAELVTDFRLYLLVLLFELFKLENKQLVLCLLSFEQTFLDPFKFSIPFSLFSLNLFLHPFFGHF